MTCKSSIISDRQTTKTNDDERISFKLYLLNEGQKTFYFMKQICNIRNKIECFVMLHVFTIK